MGQNELVDDPYADDVHRWWHLSAPSPELLEAEVDGWLGEVGIAVDLGCGLGTEVGYLASSGWRAVGVDMSPRAIGQAHQVHKGPSFMLADILRIPIKPQATDLVLDRGCFHYIAAEQQGTYESEVWRILRPGGRLLLRACLTSAGVRNHIDIRAIRETFARWSFDSLDEVVIASDTREMPALIVKLRRLPG